MKTRTGNFVHTFNQFDHKYVQNLFFSCFSDLESNRNIFVRFFNISPREAKNMDPQQRMLLQVAYHALEDAGYVPYGTPTFNPETFGCFIGASTHDYAQNLRNDIDIYYSTGQLIGGALYK